MHFKGERGRGGIYNIKDGDDKTYKFPSVTTILSAHKDKNLQSFFDEVPKEDQKRISENAANRGTVMHQYLENFTIAFNVNKDKIKSLLYSQKKTEIQIQQYTERQREAGLNLFYNLYNSPFVDELKKPVLIEGLMVSIKDKYAGRTDLIYLDKNKQLILSDYKSSGKKLEEYSDKVTKYKTQLAAYINAWNENNTKQINEGVIWVGYPGGYQKIILHESEFPIYIAYFRSLVEKFYTSKTKNKNKNE